MGAWVPDPSPTAAPSPGGAPAPVADLTKKWKITSPTPASGAAPLGGSEATIQQPEGWGTWARKRGLETAGALGGGALGSLAEPGAGTILGSATGMTAADVANKAIDDWEAGKGLKLDVTQKQMASDILANMAGSIGGEAMTKYAPSFLGKLLGTSEMPEKLSGAIDTGMEAKQAYTEGAEARAGKDLTTAQSQQAGIIKGAEPGARKELIQQETGRTPQTAAQSMVPDFKPAEGVPGINAPSEAALAEQKNAKGVYFSIKQRIGKAYGDAYENVLGEYRQHVIPAPSPQVSPLEPVAQQVDAELLWARNNAKTFDPQFQKLVGIINRMAGRTNREVIDTGGIEVPGGGSLTVLSKPVTVENGLGVLREARRIAAESKDDPTRRAAEDLIPKIREMMDTSPLPPEAQQALGKLNTKYADYKKVFTGQTGMGIAKDEDLVGAANKVFTDPKLTKYLATNATPEEKEHMVTSLGDWLASDPDRLTAGTEATHEAMANSIRALVPKSPLANAKGIMFVSGKLENLATSPQAMADVQQAFKETGQQLVQKGAIADRDAGLSELRKLGPVGADAMRAVKAASAQGPEAQARIIDKFFGELTPDKMKQMIGAKQGFKGGLVTDQMGAQPERYSGPWMMRMMSRPGAAPWFAAAAAMSAGMMGHPSPWYLMMAGGAGAMALRRTIQTATLKGLVSGSADPIMSALANGSSKVLGSNLAKAMATDMTSQAVKGIQGSGDQQPPPPKMDIGPMSKDIERKQAIQISSKEKQGVEAHVDHIEGLNKDISSGGVPDIQHDLSSGRISNAEVLKLVKNEPAKDMGSMFRGMSLPDAINSFQKGTDDEKSLALAPLSQKINDEGRNLQPQQRKALLAQLRAALGETV